MKSQLKRWQKNQLFIIQNDQMLHGGGYSLVNAEMILLRKATEVGHYNHYHLLSGQDLPIQSQETIQKFFLKNSDKEFVGFDKDIFTYGDRVYYRYFFQELAGKRKSILKSVDKFLLKMQKKLNIKRNENIEFQKGAQWFSITDGLARYVLSKDEWIKNVFKNGPIRLARNTEILRIGCTFLSP